MCDFNNLNEESKAIHHKALLECAESFGGVNFFLQLLEGIRKTKPHPLVANNSTFRFSRGTIKWNKVIFNDKLTLLLKVRVGENAANNLIPAKDHKSYKKVMNLLKTLGVIEFEIVPKNLNDGEGFTCKVFDAPSNKVSTLNPIFDALFFCSVDTVKKILAYTPKED